MAATRQRTRKNVKVTEMTKIDVDRFDGVATGANGFPILMMKAVEPAEKDVNPQGGIDETPDIAGAKGIIVDLFRLIESEAREGATGAFSEIYDIQLLAEAMSCVQSFMRMEQWGDEDDGESIYKGTAISEEDVLEILQKRKVSAEERRSLASEGHALPDGSYPIENTEDLHNAATLARSGHGDVAGAKRLIAKRAKELGVSNPLAAAQKEVVEAPEADEGHELTKTEEETSETEESQEGELSLAEVAKSAKEAAEAVKSLEAANEVLRADLAKLKATPIPGGPAITAPASVRKEQATDEAVADLARFRALSKSVGDRELRKYYEERVRELQASL